MRAKVFLDRMSSETRAVVEAAARRRFPHCELVPCSPRGLIAAWHAEGGGPKDSHSQQDLFTCFVSETKTLADADMTFATFCARIPTLTLQPCERMSPLLASPSVGITDSAAAQRFVEDFFAFPEACGRVVVIEGGDGAGKETQTRMLVKRLNESGRPTETMDFPHDAAPYGALVRIVLSGKKGGISDLDPHLFSFLYSLNRYGCLPELRYWVRRGRTVALDRYYTANFGHQASKLPADERRPFIEHLERCETGWLGLPRADQVFYLDLPSKAALEAMRQDTTRAYLDIHETAGGNYKEQVRQTYIWCCEALSGWRRVRCCDNKGERRSREALHEDIYGMLA